MPAGRHVAVLTVTLLLVANAEAARHPEAPFMLVRDTDTQEVLFEHRADHPRPIASITKLMTAMVWLDQEVDPEQVVTLTPRHMLDPIGWKSPWQIGRAVRVGDLLRFALVASDNIAAVTLVEESGLPFDVFVSRMNDVAVDIGLKESVFHNVTGLDDRNSSTAEDVARLAEAALRYPEIQAACALREAVAEPVGDQEASIRSGATDRMLWDPFWTVRVAKTGYTRLSGYCFAVVADAATGERVTMVFLGLDRDGKRFRQAERVKALLIERARQASGDTFEPWWLEP